MNKISKKVVVLLAVFSATISLKANANGEISEHVNNLSAHLTEYAEEVTWLSDKFSGVVNEYSKKGKADSDQLIEFWEEVDFHSAIETQYVPVYATIWQGIYGVKVAIDNGEKAAVVEAETSAVARSGCRKTGCTVSAKRPGTESHDDGTRANDGP